MRSIRRFSTDSFVAPDFSETMKSTSFFVPRTSTDLPYSMMRQAQGSVLGQKRLELQMNLDLRLWIAQRLKSPLPGRAQMVTPALR